MSTLSSGDHMPSQNLVKAEPALRLAHISMKRGVELLTCHVMSKHEPGAWAICQFENTAVSAHRMCDILCLDRISLWWALIMCFELARSVADCTKAIASLQTGNGEK